MLKLTFGCMLLDVSLRVLDFTKQQLVKSNPFIMEYVHLFKKEGLRIAGKEFEVDRPIYLMGDLSGDMAGVCYGLKLPWKQSLYLSVIIIDEPTWLRQNKYGKEALVFHEIGHCVLGRIEHATSIVDDSRPTSIMYPVMLDSTVYRFNREAYLQELFK